MHAFNDNTDCYRYTHSPTLSAACVSEAIDWTEKQKVLGGGSRDGQRDKDRISQSPASLFSTPERRTFKGI